MEIDWYQAMWDGRWTALEIIWNALLVDVALHWWFGPLLVFVLAAMGWKKILRLGAFIARTFAHAQP